MEGIVQACFPVYLIRANAVDDRDSSLLFTAVELEEAVLYAKTKKHQFRMVFPAKRWNLYASISRTCYSGYSPNVW